MSGRRESAIARLFRRSVLPLASYYVVTLGVPLANGAAQAGGEFVEHALIVLVIPPILVGIVAAARGAIVSLWRSDVRSGAVTESHDRPPTAWPN